jgi:hypothetical protein
MWEAQLNWFLGAGCTLTDLAAERRRLGGTTGLVARMAGGAVLPLC